MIDIRPQYKLAIVSVVVLAAIALTLWKVVYPAWKTYQLREEMASISEYNGYESSITVELAYKSLSNAGYLEPFNQDSIESTLFSIIGSFENEGEFQIVEYRPPEQSVRHNSRFNHFSLSFLSSYNDVLTLLGEFESESVNMHLLSSKTTKPREKEKRERSLLLTELSFVYIN